MSVTLNTYGIKSVNIESFNLNRDGIHFPSNNRDLIVTALRINNLILNILGYIPGIKEISGCIRMGVGLGIIGLTLIFGSLRNQEGFVFGRWYKEALLTGVAQVARGALEAFVPFGWAVNLGLDAVGTVINLKTEVAVSFESIPTMIDEAAANAGMEIPERPEGERPTYRHSEPCYPLLLSPLNWA